MARKRSGPPPPARVTRGVPDMRVKVAKDAVISHEGKEYREGKTLTVDGPLAQNLSMLGHVEILGEAK